MNEYRPGLLYDKTTITGEKNMTDGDINTSDLITNEGLIFILDKVTFVEKVFMAESHPWRTKVEFYRDIELNELITYIDPSNANMSITGAFYNVHADKVKAIKILSVSADFTRNITMFDIYGVQEVLDKYLFQDGEEIKAYTKKNQDINLIPAMTSYNSPSGLVKSSGELDARYQAWQAFDEIDSYGWISKNAPPHWISYEFSTPQVVNKYSIQVQSVNYSPISWSFQGSNDDGQTWETLHEELNGTAHEGGYERYYSFSNNKAFKSYRVYINQVHGGNYTGAKSIKMFGSTYQWEVIGTAPATKEMLDTHGMTDLSIIDNEAIQGLASDTPELLCWTDEEGESLGYEDIVPTLTGVEEYPKITESSSYYTHSPGWKVFDDKLNNSNWQSGLGVDPPHWIKVEFENPQLIDAVSMKSARFKEVDGVVYHGVKDWSLEGSNDDSSWEMLTSQTHPNNNTKKVYQLSSEKEYRYYRINIENSQVADTTIVKVEEVELLRSIGYSYPSRTINVTAVPHPQLLLPKEDIEVGKIESVALDTTASGGDLKVLVSENRGEIWHGKNNLPVDVTNLSLIKEYGYTPDELNALINLELNTRFPNGKARFAFYLEQESIDDIVEIHSLIINEKQYTMTPSVESLSVMYELLEAEKPTLYASRDDGVSWKQVKDDELTDITDQPEDNQLRVKAVLENGQEIHGLSYAWI